MTTLSMTARPAVPAVTALHAKNRRVGFIRYRNNRASCCRAILIVAEHVPKAHIANREMKHEGSSLLDYKSRHSTNFYQ
jgi:hypothetical protein